MLALPLDSSGEEIPHRFKLAHWNRVGGVIPAFSWDGTLVAMSTGSGEVAIYDVATRQLELMVTAPPQTEGISFNLEFSPDGSAIAVTYLLSDGLKGARLWDTVTGELLRTFEHEDDVWDLGFTPDGMTLVTADAAGVIKIWNVATGELIGTFTGHAGGVTDIQVSPDGRLVASGGDADVLIWDLEGLEIVEEIVGHSGGVDGIDFSPDGSLLITGSWVDESTRLWDLSANWSHERSNVPGAEDLPGAVYFAPDAPTLVASRGEGLITVWGSAGTDENYTIGGLGPITNQLAYSADSQLIGSAGSGGVMIWDAMSGDEQVILFDDEFASDIDFHPDGTMVVTSGDRGAELWPVAGGDPTQLTTRLSYAGVFSPDGFLVAVAHEDDPNQFALDIYELETMSVVARLPVGFLLEDASDQERPITGLAFSPDGALLVSTSEDALAIVWDTTTWEVSQRLEGHDASVSNAAFDPVRNELATASIDGTVKVWSLDTGVARLTLPGGPFTDVSYSADGRYLAAATDHGEVQVFMIDLDELVAEAGSRLTRGFTDTECAQYLHLAECPSQ